jgi:hypothetical protein
MRTRIIVQLKAPGSSLFNFMRISYKKSSNESKDLYVFDTYSESTDYTVK